MHIYYNMVSEDPRKTLTVNELPKEMTKNYTPHLAHVLC